MFGHDAFFHVTTVANYRAILISGYIHSDSYFAVEDIAAYYASCIKDEGNTPITLKISAGAFQVDSIDVDHNGIAEPVTYAAFGLTEDDVHEAWEKSDKTALACIDLIGSFQYLRPIPVGLITVVTD